MIVSTAATVCFLKKIGKPILTTKPAQLSVILVINQNAGNSGHAEVQQQEVTRRLYRNGPQTNLIIILDEMQQHAPLHQSVEDVNCQQDIPGDQ